MALFGKKQKTEETKAAESVAAVAKASSGAPRDLSDVLKHPRITEKATMLQAGSVYSFDVAVGASKRDIAQAVRTLYKVNPVKVAVVTVRSKVRRSMRTGKVGIKSGGRKAYVYLKKGETITSA